MRQREALYDPGLPAPNVRNARGWNVFPRGFSAVLVTSGRLALPRTDVDAATGGTEHG